MVSTQVKSVTIQDFVKEIQKEKRQFGTVLYASLAKAGYVRVDWKDSFNDTWPALHNWCIETIGKEHYTWMGTVFWFENERDALMFILRWGRA